MFLFAFGLGASQVSAAQQLTVNVRDNSPIDIILCAGETQVDLTYFEANIRAALHQAGVDIRRVQIQAGTLSTISAADADAATIFNTWQKYPLSEEPMFRANWGLSGNTLHTSADVHWTGYWDVSAKNSVDYTIQFETMSTDGWMDPYGFAFRMQSLGEDTWQFYAIQLDATASNAVSGHGFVGHPVSGIRLARVLRWNPQETKQAWHSGPLGQYEMQLPVSSATWLAQNKGTIPRNGVWNRIKIQLTGRRIQVWLNDILSIDYTDASSMAILKGGYGPYVQSNPTVRYRNMTIESVKYKELIDSVRSPRWRPGSHRFIIDVVDFPRADFDSLPMLGELVERLEQDEAYYAGWGSPSSQTYTTLFVQKNNGRGKYFLNTSSTLYTDTALYIEPIVNKGLPSQDDAYLLQGKTYSFETK